MSVTPAATASITDSSGWNLVTATIRTCEGTKARSLAYRCAIVSNLISCAFVGTNALPVTIDDHRDSDGYHRDRVDLPARDSVPHEIGVPPRLGNGSGDPV